MIEDAPFSQSNEASPSQSTTKKRKRPAISTPRGVWSQPIDLAAGDEAEEPSPKKTKSLSRKPKDEEKRLRRFRQHAPSSYLEKLHRATTQRMFVIDRTRSGTAEIPEETIDMAGTTGNIYSVNISQQPSCTCPDNRKGNQCKHIVYVLHNVLKAPRHLVYQLAFLSSELREIFSSAPPPTSSAFGTSSSESPSNRKPVEGDCPICFTEFSREEEIVWCKSACGNNIHVTCFAQWAKSQRGKEVRCVYCRTPWQENDEEELMKRIKKDKGGDKVGKEGYVNVAEELGLSGARDYSTYHQCWVRRQGLGYY